jgi:hypothetical protein
MDPRQYYYNYNYNSSAAAPRRWPPPMTPRAPPYPHHSIAAPPPPQRLHYSHPHACTAGCHCRRTPAPRRILGDLRNDQHRPSSHLNRNVCASISMLSRYHSVWQKQGYCGGTCACLADCSCLLTMPLLPLLSQPKQ